VNYRVKTVIGDASNKVDIARFRLQSAMIFRLTDIYIQDERWLRNCGGRVHNQTYLWSTFCWKKWQWRK